MTEVVKMDDERITLRMGTEEVQTMDSFLDGRPELGNRSQFIRTAVREYINRDAGVSAPSGRTGVFVGLPEAYMNAMARIRAKGLLYDEAEYIRNVLTKHFMSADEESAEAREALKASTLEVLER